jgi:hypothetical protein
MNLTIRREILPALSKIVMFACSIELLQVSSESQFGATKVFRYFITPKRTLGKKFAYDVKIMRVEMYGAFSQFVG